MPTMDLAASTTDNVSPDLSSSTPPIFVPEAATESNLSEDLLKEDLEEKKKQMMKKKKSRRLLVLLLVNHS